VMPRHAHITRVDRGWLLECTSSGRVQLVDGTEFRDLRLYRGTTFRIGATILQSIAGDDAKLLDMPAAKTVRERANEAAASLASIHCVRCNVLVAHLPADAKFCPRCGQDLPQRANLLRGDGNSSRSLLELLLPLLDATLPNPLGKRLDRVDADRPRTLLAYINTLVQLGIRYELGDGTSKNVG